MDSQRLSVRMDDHQSDRVKNLQYKDEHRHREFVKDDFVEKENQKAKDAKVKHQTGFVSFLFGFEQDFVESFLAEKSVFEVVHADENDDETGRDSDDGAESDDLRRQRT